MNIPSLLQKIKKRFSVYAFLAAVLFIGVIAFKTWQEVPFGKLTFNITYLAIAILLNPLLNLYYTGLWRRIVNDLGEEVPLLVLWRALIYSAIMRYLPGRIWNCFGKVHWATKSGAKEQTILISTLLDLVFLNIGSLIIGIYSVKLLLPPIYAATTIVVLAITILILLQPRFIAWATGLLNRTKDTSVSITSRFSYGEIVIVTSGYAMLWIGTGFQLFLFTRSFYHLSWNTMPLFISINAAASLIGFVSFITPSGIGVKEAVTFEGFKTIAPASVAILMAILHRLFYIFLEVMMIVAFLCFDRGAWKNLIKKGAALGIGKRDSEEKQQK